MKSKYLSRLPKHAKAWNQSLFPISHCALIHSPERGRTHCHVASTSGSLAGGMKAYLLESTKTRLCFRDTVRRKLLINHPRSGSLRSTFGLAPPYAVSYTADYRRRLVERPRISFNGMALTVSRDNMSSVVVGTFLGHHISKEGGKISGRMPLK